MRVGGVGGLEEEWGRRRGGSHNGFGLSLVYACASRQRRDHVVDPTASLSIRSSASSERVALQFIVQQRADYSCCSKCRSAGQDVRGIGLSGY